MTEKQSRRAQYLRRRAKLDAEKLGPCMDCGGTFPPCAMDFDHVRGEKYGSVSTMLGGCSWDMVKAEIAKCDLVCANCHRIRHHA